VTPNCPACAVSSKQFDVKRNAQSFETTQFVNETMGFVLQIQHRIANVDPREPYIALFGTHEGLCQLTIQGRGLDLVGPRWLLH